MKWTVLICLFCVCVTACSNRQRAEDLQKRETALNQKEQELLLKEQTLQLQAGELAKQRQRMDSTLKADTTGRVNAALTGQWTTTMTCTETTCAGSAVGDTKTEQWVFSYEGTALMARAIVNAQLVRVYAGSFKDNTIELTASQQDTAQAPAATMTVRLRMTDDAHLEGAREIVRGSGCKVVYALKLEKQ